MSIFKKKKTKPDLSGSVRRLVDREKPIVGIDIGSSAIKIVSMKKNHELDKWVLEPIPIGMVNQGKIETKTPLADIIKNALKTNKIRTKNCALYLSASQLLVREYIIPVMNDNQIRENIKQEIRSMLAQGYEEYYVDYKVIEHIKDITYEDNQEYEPGEGQLRVLASAVPESLLREYIDTLKLAGLKVRYIDVLPNIAGKLCNFIYMKDTEDKPKNICIIDFGASKTEIAMYHKADYAIHKTNSNGGEYLTTIIANELDIDEIDAEDYKRRINLFEEESNNLLAKQVYEYFDYLIIDLERTMEFYNNKYGQNIDVIYGMGGGFLLSGLSKHLQESLNIEVRSAGDFFQHLRHVNDIGRDVSIFSHAIGVTYREEWKNESWY